MYSKYLVTAGKDFASFSKNVLTNDFDFIFDGFDLVFDGFDFDFDGFDFDFSIIKQGLLKIVTFFGETFSLKVGFVCKKCWKKIYLGLRVCKFYSPSVFFI